MAVKTLSGALFIAALILLLIACMAEFGSAQTTGALLPALPPTFFSVSGAPAANAKVCTLAAGTTTTWRATYSDSALGTPLPNPITLNSIGIPTTNGNTQSAIYISPLAYKVILYAAGTGNTCNGTAVGSVIWTRDNVYDIGDLLRSQISAGTATIAIPSYIFSALPTAGNVGRLARVSDAIGGLWMDSGTQWVRIDSPLVNPLEAPFNAKGDGTTDDTASMALAVAAVGGGHLLCPAGKTFLISSPLYLYPANQGITWDGPANCVIRAKSGVTAFNMIVDGSGSASGESTVGSIGGFTIDGIDKSAGSCLNGFMVYDHDWGLYNQLFVQNCANDGIIVSQWGSANTTSTGATTMGVTTALTLANISPNGYTIHAFDLLLLDCDGTSATTTGCNAGNAGAEQVEVMSVLGSVVTLTAPVALDHMAGFRVNRSGFGDLLTFNNPYVVFAGNAGFEIMPGSDVNGIMVNGPIALHGDVTNMILRGNNGTVNGGQFTASGNEAIRLGETTDGDSFSAKYWTIHNPGDLEANSQDCILVSTHSLGIYVDGILNSQVCNNASTGSSGNGVVVTSGVGNWTVTNSNSSTASVGSFNIIPFVGSGGNSGVSVFAGCGSSACNNALTLSSYKAAPIDFNVASSPGAGGAAGTGGVRGGNGSTVTWSFTSGGALTTSAGASIGGSTMINGTLTDQVTSIDESSNAGADAHLNFRTATYNSATVYQSESTGNLVIDPSSRTLEVRSTAASFQVNGGGIVVGAATGGAKGSGTINVASDIYKNNTAYTNPDYAFEKFYSGKIVKFAKNPGASQYGGLIPLPALRKYTQQNFALPGVHEASGMFERNDVLLEKLEEAYLYIFQLSDRITRLEKSAK